MSAGAPPSRDGERTAARPSRGSRFGPIAFVLRILLGILLLVLIVRSFGGGRVLGETLSRLPLWAILAALAVNTLDRLLMTYKWLLLLRARRIDLPFLRAMKIYCSSLVWGMFLPMTIGADVVRVVSTAGKGIAGELVLASVIVERALGFMASLLLGLLGLLILSSVEDLPQGAAWLGWLGGGLLVAGLTATAVSFSERTFGALQNGLLRRFGDNRIAARLRSVHEGYHAYREHPGRLLAFFWLSFLEQLVPVLSIWIIARGMGVDLSPLYAVGAVAISFLIARIPLTPGGLGVLEGSLVFLLTLAGVPAPQAIAIAVASRLLEIVSWLPWWIAFVASRKTLRRPQREGGLER